MFSKIFTSYYNIIQQSFYENNIIYNQIIYKLDSITNIETIGQILYSYYAFFFLAAGIILLIALIGAVTLTKKEKKKQNYLTKNLYKQLSRNYLRATFNIKENKN
jgi:NADH:ubiquinone oxidoreductase subunit 6 (subunit J)